jgi:hypothetical protein
MDVGKPGWCLAHKVYHKMELSPCWKSLRDFLHAREIAGYRDPAENMKAYEKAAGKK